MTQTTAPAPLTASIREMLADYRAEEGGGYSDGTIITCTRSDNDAEEIARMVAAGEMTEAVGRAYLAVALATGAEIVAAWPGLDADTVADLLEEWIDEE